MRHCVLETKITLIWTSNVLYKQKKAIQYRQAHGEDINSTLILIEVKQKWLVNTGYHSNMHSQTANSLTIFPSSYYKHLPINEPKPMMSPTVLFHSQSNILNWCFCLYHVPFQPRLLILFHYNSPYQLFTEQNFLLKMRNLLLQNWSLKKIF
jgi:hypothetical protein